MTEAPQISTTLRRSGFMIEIEGTGSSVTFYPYDKDRTYNAILEKCKELGEDLTSDMNNYDVHWERHNIDIQLTEIYDEYYTELENKRIGDEEQLLTITHSIIKETFRDQSGKFYAVIEKDNHDEIVNIDSEYFDEFLLKIYHDVEHRLISKEKRNNAKTFLKSCIKEKRVLHNRIARVNDIIYYNLNNEYGQCISINKEGCKLIQNPFLFWPPDPNTEQLPPDFDYDKNRNYVREIIDGSTIKHRHQKIIDEVYTFSLFIPDIAHPMPVPVGPPGSGKSMHFRVKKLIVDPINDPDALVQKLPSDDRDRRVTIYDGYLSYFDNESMLSYDEMDELCMWVTGYSKTVRVLHTTDEKRRYSGKRAIGINGINIPVSNSDIMSRCFITEHASLISPTPKDSKDGKTKNLVRETKYLAHIQQTIPKVLGYIFDTLVKALQRFDEVDAEINPTDRLADWMVWGETIARVLGYEKCEFLKAWDLNRETQSYAVIRNNTLAILLIKYAFNKRWELEFKIEPHDLLKELMAYASEIGINYNADKNLPKNSVWLSRKLNMIELDLRVAGIVIDKSKSDDRLIVIRKDLKSYTEQQQKQKNLELIDSEGRPDA
jgi:hypothetical protein